MRPSLNRRELLAAQGGAGLASLGLDRIHVPARASSANEKLNIAVIGCGGQGAENLKQVSARNTEARDLPRLVAGEARVSCTRRPRPDHDVLVRRRSETFCRPGWWPQARRQRRDRGRHQGNPLLGRMDRRRLGPTARGSVPRLQTTSLVGTSCSRAEPSPGMATRLPGRSPRLSAASTASRPG